MGPSSPTGPVSHPGRMRHQRNLNSNLVIIHPSTFHECTQQVSPPRIFRPNLCRYKYLLANFILPSPPSRTHPGDTISWLTNRIIAAPNPSIFRRTREHQAAGDDDTSPPVDGTGLPVKGKGGWAAGPEGPHPRINTRDLALHNNSALKIMKQDQLINKIKCFSTTTFKQRNLTLRLTKGKDKAYNDRKNYFCQNTKSIKSIDLT